MYHYAYVMGYVIFILDKRINFKGDKAASDYWQNHYEGQMPEHFDLSGCRIVPCILAVMDHCLVYINSSNRTF